MLNLSPFLWIGVARQPFLGFQWWDFQNLGQFWKLQTISEISYFMVGDHKMDISGTFIAKHILNTIFKCVEFVSIFMGRGHSSAISRLPMMGFSKSWTVLKTSDHFLTILFYGRRPKNGYFVYYFCKTYYEHYFQLCWMCLHFYG